MSETQQQQRKDSSKIKTSKKKPSAAAAATTTILSVDFDALLPSIGEMGRYQLGLYLLMCIPATLPAAFLAFNQVFLSAVPQHWCTVTSLLAHNLTVEHVKRLSIPLRKAAKCFFVVVKQAKYFTHLTDDFC